MAPMGKMVVLLGLVIVVIGLLMMFSDKIPFLGRLPGDIHVKRDNFEFHFPLTTSILLSLLISAIIWVISYFSKK